MHARHANGFTLVELMVVVVVVAILAAMAMPSYRDMIDRYRLRGVTDSVVSFINDARAESVKHGRDVNIAFKGTTTAWCVGANAAVEPATQGDAIPAAAACDCSGSATSCKIGSDQKVFSKDSNKGVALDALPASFTFDRKLGTVNPLATKSVTLSSPLKRFDLKMTVTAMGQVSLCVPSSSQGPIPGVPSC